MTPLRFDDERTTLGPGLVVAVGARALAVAHFHRDPPSPSELEQGIDHVEDAIAAAGLTHQARGDLVTHEPLVLEALGLPVGAERVTRDEVEARFEGLARLALGRPARVEWKDGVLSREAAAALLILRELMHHLGYEAVRRDGRCGARLGDVSVFEILEDRDECLSMGGFRSAASSRV